MHKFFLFLFFVTNDAEGTRLFSRCQIRDESSLVVACNQPPFVSFSKMECSRKCFMLDNKISIPTTPLFDSLLLPKYNKHFGINLISYDSSPTFLFHPFHFLRSLHFVLDLILIQRLPILVAVKFLTRSALMTV